MAGDEDLASQDTAPKVQIWRTPDYHSPDSIIDIHIQKLIRQVKKIINPWRNHPEYNCFGCCPENPIGLHMEFYEDGDYIVSNWHPQRNYQGWVNTMHGGILSTLIDEVCGWVVTRKLQTSGYTVQLNVKFRKAIPTTEPVLTIRAKVAKQVRNLVYISAEITNSKDELCNEGEAVYFLMNQEKAKEMGFLHCDVEE